MKPADAAFHQSFKPRWHGFSRLVCVVDTTSAVSDPNTGLDEIVPARIEKRGMGFYNMAGREVVCLLTPLAICRKLATDDRIDSETS